jgi:5'-deoxynucleotidase YfbR-like HD superfamily hydrolase
MISQYEDRLSEVPRWTIVRTIQRQSVMDHSARVAIAAPRIAIKYLGVAADDYEALYHISRAALLHDQDEYVSGDISSPAKAMMELGSFSVNASRYAIEFPLQEISKEHYKAVKAADFYEALVFLAKETALGNRTLNHIWSDVRNNFARAFRDHQQMVVELTDDAMQFITRQQDPLR